MEVMNDIPLLEKKSPSLLRQIMDEVDELDAEKKEALLWQIKMEKALDLAKHADVVFKDKFLPLNDDEITLLVSKNRKAAHDAKIHH
jgi:hypothetical protein